MYLRCGVVTREIILGLYTALTAVNQVITNMTILLDIKLHFIFFLKYWPHFPSLCACVFSIRLDLRSIGIIRSTDKSVAAAQFCSFWLAQYDKLATLEFK